MDFCHSTLITVLFDCLGDHQGTTGKPKGAMLSHFTLINNAVLSSKRMVTNEEKIICMPLPLFHAFAYVAGSVMMLVTGGTLGKYLCLTMYSLLLLTFRLIFYHLFLKYFRVIDMLARK
jgi:acyl-CoA synthetase (AMP-forming)/AMP-acid ligase II